MKQAEKSARNGQNDGAWECNNSKYNKKQKGQESNVDSHSIREISYEFQ